MGRTARMKILYLITRAECGGAQVHVADLMQGFAGRAEIEVATGDPDGYLRDEALRLSVPYHQIPSLVQPISPLKDASALLGAVALLRRVQPDLIHCHTSKAGFIGR